jgi:hypothetical protein
MYAESARHAGVELTTDRLEGKALAEALATNAWDLRELEVPTATPPDPRVFGADDPALAQLFGRYDAARTEPDRVAALRAIDAALYAAQPMVLGWGDPAVRVAFANRFGMPTWGASRTASDIAMPAVWWVDPERDAALAAARADPDVPLPPVPEKIDFWRRELPPP